MTKTRRSLGVVIRRWWGELLLAAAWVGLLFIAQLTSRTPQLLAGSLVVCAVIGALHVLEGVRTAAREVERVIAAEVVESVCIPRDTRPCDAAMLAEFRARIATAIRAHGAHLRETRHG